MAKTVLILCTGNSCRSQMAEALVNAYLSPDIRALSAGTQPGAQVATGAIEALQLAGLAAHDLRPKTIDAVIDEPIDLVVTVCDNAKETCPVFPRAVPMFHMAFHDPHSEPLESFIRVRDDIHARLLPEIRRRLAGN
ncbi:MAG TPA: arsenate reductase ArsC [Acidiferrobacter sp.]|nr:arsenate reductase ArsC [Acidiferrobacter sp.]